MNLHGCQHFLSLFIADPIMLLGSNQRKASALMQKLDMRTHAVDVTQKAEATWVTNRAPTFTQQDTHRLVFARMQAIHTTFWRQYVLLVVAHPLAFKFLITLQWCLSLPSLTKPSSRENSRLGSMAEGFLQHAPISALGKTCAYENPQSHSHPCAHTFHHPYHPMLFPSSSSFPSSHSAAYSRSQSLPPVLTFTPPIPIWHPFIL